MTKKLEKLALAGRLEIKLAETNTETAAKSFSGYGAVFGNQDFVNDIIAPGAFSKTLAEHKTAGTTPSMFFNHDQWRMPIGVWTSLEQDDFGLKVDGELLDTEAGRDAHIAMKAGAVTGLSIGFYATDFTIEGGVRTITEAKLVEISVVTFPCNDRARVSDVKSADLSDDDFLAKLTELGVSEDDAAALLDKRNTKEASNDNEEVDAASDETDDAEAKYYMTAVEAVNNLIRELKQENHGR